MTRRLGWVGMVRVWAVAGNRARNSCVRALAPEGIVMSLWKRLKFAVSAMALSLLFACSSYAQYTKTDLVTDTGTPSNPPDASLVNGWGLVALPTSPFWVSDNGTGVSTLYTGTGAKI